MEPERLAGGLIKAKVTGNHLKKNEPRTRANALRLSSAVQALLHQLSKKPERLLFRRRTFGGFR